MTPDREKLALEALPIQIAKIRQRHQYDHDHGHGCDCASQQQLLNDRGLLLKFIEARALLAETAPSGEGEPVAIELPEETDYWAVQSPSGAHIGMWNEIGHAANAAAEVGGSRMIPLRVVAPTPSASEGRAGEPENAQNVADALRACDWSNVPIGNKAIIAHAADLLSARDETIARLTRERDETLDRIEELERHAESVSAKFEKELWLEMKALLNECHFDWNFVDGDGLLAAEAAQHIRETLTSLEEGGKRSAARAEAAEARLAVMGEALRPFARVADWSDRIPGWVGEVIARTAGLNADHFRAARAALAQEGRG